MPRTIRTSIPVCVGIPLDLLDQIDELAKSKYVTRSSYVVEAIREKVKKDLNKK